MQDTLGRGGAAGARLPGLLPVLYLAIFVTTGSGSARAPFLLAMAADLATSLPAVAGLVGLSSISWGVAALVAGVLSDRLGRRRFLVGALLTLAASLLGTALAPTYAAAVAWALVGGVGGGAFMGTVFATVADHTPAERRGRVLGAMFTGQSVALVVGVPLAALIGVVVGWRGASAVQALTAAALAGAAWLVVPPGGAARAVAAAPGRARPLRRVLDAPLVALLGAGAAERVCYAGMAVYLATYLTTAYDLPLQALALALGVVALGNLLGNLLGGQVADRLPARPLFFAATLLATAVLALPLFVWRPGVAGTVGLGLAYALVNALGRPPLMATLSGVPAAVRGTVLGLNVTSASVGWLAATALGGWLITTEGFASLGLLCAAASLLGAALATLSWWAARQPSAAVAAEPAD